MSNNSTLNRGELDALLQATKDPSSRNSHVIPKLHAIYKTASSLLIEVRKGDENTEQICDDLIQALRVLRNACASGQATCSALLTFGLVDLLADTIDVLGAGAAALNWTLPAVVTQLLANFSNTDTACAAAVWERLFPHHLIPLSHVDSCPAQEALSLVILTCCKSANDASEALCSPQGAPIITAMLHANLRFTKAGTSNHTLPLLLGYLVFTQDMLLPMFVALATSGEDVVEWKEDGWKVQDILEVQLVAAHSLLLQELAIEAHDAPLDSSNAKGELEESERRKGQSMSAVMALLGRLAAQPTAAPSSTLEELAAQHQLLQDALHLLRDICARDDSGTGLTSGYSLARELSTAGMMTALLAMLKALGPIDNPRREQPNQNLGELAPELASESAHYVMTQPYEGYRSDVLAVIANAAHKRPEVQSAVAACGGVELVLSQCQVDDKSPLAREWALWAVRNLCEGSDTARDAIQELKACAALDSEELQKAGVKVTLDETTGKLKVSKREEEQDERTTFTGAGSGF